MNIRATMAHSKIGGAAAGHTVVWIWIKDAEANGAKQIFLLLNLHCTIFNSWATTQFYAPPRQWIILNINIAVGAKPMPKGGNVAWVAKAPKTKCISIDDFDRL